MVETSRLVQHGSAWVEKRIGYHVQLVEKKKMKIQTKSE